MIRGTPVSVLVKNTNNWREARAIAKTPWAQNKDATFVRAFMRGCGIPVDPDGPYDWRIVRFVLVFQRGFCYESGDFGSNGWSYLINPLKDDGLAGAKTELAMSRSAGAGYRVWKYLKWAEIATKDPNKNLTINNPVIYTTRETVKLFILMREVQGSPIVIASWFRNLRWNNFVGGAKLSQHMLGLAFDFNPHPKLTEKTLRLLVDKVSPGSGGGVGVIEVWRWNGRRWTERINIVGPSHVDIRKYSSRWSYKTTYWSK